MNVFVFGLSSGGDAGDALARDALAGFLGDAGFIAAERIETWTAPSAAATCAWASHAPDLLGGVRYVHAEPDRVALFCGRPVMWTTDGRADGRSPLDPSLYLGPPRKWAPALDGRFAALRYRDGERTLDVCTDPLGAYPLFRAETGGTLWIGNVADVLGRLVGASEMSAPVLACLLGGGWSLGGDPAWRGIRRLERGAVSSFEAARPGGGAPRRSGRAELLPTTTIVRLPGAGWDPRAAAEILVESTRALADWPGRPSRVALTGGRDSRLILAAALASGIDFEAVTGGAPDSPDVAIARALCESTATPHRMLGADPHGDRLSNLQRAAEMAWLTASGTASLADAAGFPLGPASEAALPIFLSGQGGEIGRGYYGKGDGLDADGLARKLYAAFVARRPWRPEIVSREGRRLIEEELRQWVDAQLEAGASARDIPDLFYLLRRMATWAAPTHGCVEWVRDTASPLWSDRLIPHLLGPPARDRARELFHLRVLEELAPELVDIPFADGRGWTARQGMVRRRAASARSFGRKATLRLASGARGAWARRRKTAAETTAKPFPTAPVGAFGAVQAAVKGAARERPHHAAWPLLDRDRVSRLLAADPDSLDEMSRYHVWRLATVFLGESQNTF